MIEVRDYDPAWAERFARIRAEYAAALEADGVAFLSIEHIGSTSVPGLAAKPIIDIDIVVGATEVDAATSVLVRLGFEPRGNLGIPERWAFWEPERLTGTNTYVVVDGSLALRNHLAVRDTLRGHLELCAEYGDVKKRVGAAAADIDEYAAGKNATVQRVLAAAGICDEERAAIDAVQIPQTEREH